MKFLLFGQKSLKYIGFNDTPMIIIGVPLLGFLVPWLFLGLSVNEAWHCYKLGWPFAIFNTALFWIGDRYIICFFRRRFNAPGQTSKRIFYGFSAVALFTIALSYLLDYVMQFAPRGSGNPYENATFLLSVSSSLFVTLAVCSIYEAVYYLNLWKDSLAVNEKLQKEHVTSQLEALKSQVNPHFLFNSLNTLSAIIPEDPVKAVEFVQNLSHVYRCILDLKEKKEIRLSEELECLDRYAFLLKTRFGENIVLDMDIKEKDLNRFVVPLCLQMLTENAVKHNVVSTRNPLTIHYFVENDHLVVANKIHRKEQEMGNTGTGLRNIRNRYRLTFDRELVVRESENEFRVELPLISIGTYESTHH